MATTGRLAIAGIVLLVVQLVFGGALYAASPSRPVVLAPLVLGLVCLAAAFVWGLAKGPAALRLAVLFGFASLTLFGVAILTIHANTSALLAASAALFILAISLGIFAYTNERATSDESAVRE